MSEDLIKKYARLMGMKVSEVMEVVPGHRGARVRTHDGAWTHVSDLGVGEPADAPEVTHERDAGVASDDREPIFVGEAHVGEPVTKPETDGDGDGEPDAENDAESRPTGRRGRGRSRA